VDRALICAPGKSGIFLCEWHKNLQADPKNDCRTSLPLGSLSVQTPAPCAKMRFIASGLVGSLIGYHA
jgi:hypothetical protein